MDSQVRILCISSPLLHNKLSQAWQLKTRKSYKLTVPKGEYSSTFLLGLLPTGSQNYEVSACDFMCNLGILLDSLVVGRIPLFVVTGLRYHLSSWLPPETHSQLLEATPGFLSCGPPYKVVCCFFPVKQHFSCFESLPLCYENEVLYDIIQPWE